MDEILEKNKIFIDFIPEKPINSFDDQKDLFGYKIVAKDIAKSILKLQTDTGYVLAINGKWGSGKTSFLYYIEQYLTNCYSELSVLTSSKKAIILRFDPWLFSGHQDIINQFFIQLQNTMIRGKKPSSETLKVLNKFFKYGSELRKVATLEAQVAGWTFTGLHTLTEAKIKSSVHSIAKLKDEIIKELPKLDDKIVIIIDDIDRLIPEEICELFRAIKAIGDFPNIVYLLAYDEEVVSSALEHGLCNQFWEMRQQSCFGIHYLEKIVQFSINIPKIGDYQIHEYFKGEIFNKLFSNTHGFLKDSDQWNQQYDSGLKFLLRTPRKVIKLYNALLLLYPSIENEVNVIDFISLEIVRENYPWLYDLIWKNYFLFIKGNFSTSDIFLRSNELNSITEFHLEWRNKISMDHRHAVTNIICNLFPEVDKIIQGVNKGRDPLSYRDPKYCNICLNYETFIKYFRYQVEPNRISTCEFRNIVSNIDHPGKLLKNISELKINPRRVNYPLISIIVGILQNWDPNLSVNSLKYLIMDIFQLPNEVFSVFHFDDGISNEFGDNISIITQFLFRALQAIHKDERLEILSLSVSHGTSIPITALFIDGIHGQHGDVSWGKNGKLEEEKIIISLNDVKKIEEIFIQKVSKQFSNDLMMFASPILFKILKVWNKCDPSGKSLKEVIDRLWNDEKMIIQVIIESRKYRFIYRIDSSSLEPYISSNDFNYKIQRLINEERISPEQKQSFSDFLGALDPFPK